MILFLLAAAQQLPPPPDADAQEDIVVVARRLAKVRVSYDAKDGKLLRCTIKQSSGSPTAERLVCEAARQCAAENPTLGDRHLAPCIRDRTRLLYGRWRAERLAAQAPRQP